MNLEVVTADVIGGVAIICLVTRLLGSVAQRLGQPAVIGWIVGGILLGPGLLGRLPGHLTTHLFPVEALPYFSVLAQFAIVVFMFTVGYEISLRPLRGHGCAVPLIAVSALVVPLLLGSGAAVVDWRQFGSLAGAHGSEHLFVIFMGVVMSITALPVLAAIIRERGIAGTTVGTVATAAAGVMDVAAWLVLAAALVGTGHGTGRSWLETALLSASFIAAMLLAVRPALKFLLGQSGSLLSNQVPIAFLLAMGSAWVTASLGIQPVFGGFLAGLTMPRLNGAQDADVVRSMNELGGILLPLFFASVGLSVDIGTLHSSDLTLLVLVIAVACLGKMGPAYAGSRLSGLTPRQSARVSALINTRGLTELIVLNVGLVDQIISRTLFAILVLMAFFTTLSTSPLLSVIDGWRPRIANIDRLWQPKSTASVAGAAGTASQGARTEPAARLDCAGRDKGADKGAEVGNSQKGDG